MTTLFVSCAKEDAAPDTMEDPVPIDPVIPEEFQAFSGIFDGEGIGCAVNLTKDVLLIFNKSGNKYAWFEEQEIKVIQDVTDNDGPFQDCPFNNIGAIGHWVDSRIYFFDDEGENYSYFDFDPEDVEGSWNDNSLFVFASNSWETYQWGPDNTCPFAKIGAMWAYSSPGTNCFDAAEYEGAIWMANEDGDEIVYYTNNTFQDEKDIDEWTAENNCGGPDGLIPFTNIGAVCRYVKANMIQELFFTEDGTQFCYYTVSEGVFSEIYDLY